MDQHDLDFDALLAQVLRLLANGVNLVEEFQPGRGARADQLGGVLEFNADHADAQFAVIEDVRALDPIRVVPGDVINNVGAQEGEVGARLMLEQPGDAVIELVVAVRGSHQAPGIFHIDGRRILQQAGIGRGSADIISGSEEEGWVGELGGLLVKHRRQMQTHHQPGHSCRQ